MNVETRMKIERRIARRVIKDALAAGYTLGVFDGEEITIKRCGEASKVLAAMFTTDMDKLLFYTHIGCVGEVLFVYGNDGFDVIADYHTSLETVLAGANALGEKIASSY